MNSLVVLFSLIVLAAAKPNYPALINYGAPALALAPTAISHQSRIDVKSSPAIVATEVVAPVSRSVITEPAILPAPISYSAPFAVAPAAVSSQSRFDIKSSPALLSKFAAASLARTAPFVYGSPLAYAPPIAYNTPIGATYTSSFYVPGLTSAITPTVFKSAAVEHAAESVQAKSAPVDPALPVAPTETPEVAAARAAHLEAKAFEEARHIQKRSVGFVAPATVVSSYAAPVLSYAASPVSYSSPVTSFTAPLITRAYSVHPY